MSVPIPLSFGHPKIRLTFLKLIIMIQGEEMHLRKMDMAAIYFFTEEEKITYLAEHIDQVDTYDALAGELSKIREKPTYLKEVLKKKIVQCLLYFNQKGDTQYQGILNSLLKNSPNLELEYQGFFEEIVREDSSYRKEEYLESIFLADPPEAGALFSLSDKVRILGYKFLLKMDPRHPEALSFFLEYDQDRKVSEYQHFFIIEENQWSGQGILNEYGEWILPPLFDLGKDQKLFNDGFARVFFTENFFPKNQHGSSGIRYQPFGNWINKKGQFLIDFLVKNPEFFSEGKAKCFHGRETKYIDTVGNFLEGIKEEKQPSPGKGSYVLGNGFSVEYSNVSKQIVNKEGKVIIELDKKFNSISLMRRDNLIRYGYVNGRGGEGRYGYLDLEGNILTEPIFHMVDDEDDGENSFNGYEVMIVSKAYMEYGLINKKFEIIIPPEYDRLTVVNRKYLVGKKREYYYLFDHEGNYTAAEVPPLFKEQLVFFKADDDIGTVTLGKTRHLIDLEGNILSTFENYSIRSKENGTVVVENAESKLGIFGVDGNEVLPCIYEDIRRISEDMVLVKLDGGYLSVDLRTGAIFKFPEEYKIGQFDTSHTEEFIRFEKDGKVGIVSARGEVIVPFLYDSIKRS